jgi:hypothetical protein
MIKEWRMSLRAQATDLSDKRLMDFARQVVREIPEEDRRMTVRTMDADLKIQLECEAAGISKAEYHRRLSQIQEAELE